MIKNKKIVIASRNKGKIAELLSLLSGFSVDLKKIEDFEPIPIIDEDGLTFDDNAYKKASFTARILGLPAIADDSGLVVNALNGAPGVYSARYGGLGITDLERCDKLLRELNNVHDRRAYFQCVVSVALPNGKALTYDGKCYGNITTKIIGNNGFGYDPIFFYEQLNKTFAQLSNSEKNKISHRGIALNKLTKEFDKVLKWFEF